MILWIESSFYSENFSIFSDFFWKSGEDFIFSSIIKEDLSKKQDVWLCIYVDLVVKESYLSLLFIDLIVYLKAWKAKFIYAIFCIYS